MARFEQFVLSDRRDEWGIPRRTAVTVLNVDEISTVHDRTVDTIFRTAFHPTCPRGVFPAVELVMRSGAHHTVLLGHFPTVDEADAELDRFAQWLTGRSLL